MPRLIDADALIAEFQRLGLGEHSLIEKMFSDGVYAVIHNAPSIEYVPASKVEELTLAMADMNAKFAEEKLAFLKLIKELAEYNPRWIPVTERLPLQGEDVFAWASPFVMKAWRNEKGDWVTTYGPAASLKPVTHWMPMPEPPKMDGGAE